MLSGILLMFNFFYGYNNATISIFLTENNIITQMAFTLDLDEYYYKKKRLIIIIWDVKLLKNHFVYFTEQKTAFKAVGND